MLELKTSRNKKSESAKAEMCEADVHGCYEGTVDPVD